MMLGSIPSMSEWAHANTSRFYLKNSEIASRISSNRFFPIFSTLEGSLLSIWRSTRSSIG